MVAPPHVAPPTVHFTTKRTEAKRESSGARMIAHRHYRSTAPRRATHSPYISSKEPTLRNIFSSLFRNEEIMVDCCNPKVDCCVSIFPPRPDPLPSSSLSHSHFSLSSPRSATGTGRRGGPRGGPRGGWARRPAMAPTSGSRLRRQNHDGTGRGRELIGCPRGGRARRPAMAATGFGSAPR